MSGFDKIISERLHGATDYPVNDTMWSSIEKELPQAGGSNSMDSFSSAMIGGIAASTLMGVLLTSLPNIGETASHDQAAVSHQQSVTTPSSDIKVTEPTFSERDAFSPQQEHEIVFVSSKTEFVAPETQEVIDQNDPKENVNQAEPIKDPVAAEPTHQESPAGKGLAETPSFDFKAVGIQCAGETIAFKTDDKADNVQWIIDGVDVLEGSRVEHQFEGDGMHEVVMLVDANGQSTSVRKEIEIYQQPVPDVAVSVSSSSNCFEQEVKFEAEPGENQYMWTIDGSEFKGADVNAQLSQGNYNIALQTINIHGCVSDYNELLSVEGGKEIFLPNSFSPMDQNGRNDKWFPVGLEANDQFTLRIYNVAQNMVYETNEVAPWNGMVSNSTQKVSRGQQYFYELIVRDDCGATKKFDGVINIR